jgi:hypothetical protein
MAKANQEDLVVWVRLPKPMSIAELKKAGLAGGECFGGDTCIAASSFSEKAGIVVGGDLRTLLRKANLMPRDPCFGGSSCIV